MEASLESLTTNVTGGGGAAFANLATVREAEAADAAWLAEQAALGLSSSSDADEEERSVLFSVAVPEGLGPGDLVLVTTPSGSQHEVGGSAWMSCRL